MDLKSLLSDNQKSNTNKPQQLQQPPQQQPHAAFTKKPSSIDLLVNNVDDNNLSFRTNSNSSHSSSPLIQPMQSPIIINKTTGPPLSSSSSSSSTNQHHHTQRTPSGHTIHFIKERNSITSLTNDTDVDIDGKETPSITRRLSHDTNSETNSPVLAKKSLGGSSSRASLLADLIDNETDEHLNSKQVKKEVEVKSPIKKESKKEEEKQEESKRKPKSSNKNKPKRYSKPPIWASKWRNSKHRDFSSNGEGGVDTRNKFLSITGVKPYNDFTRRISNWLYSHISSIPPEQRRFLELEIRFGQIFDHKSDRRIHLPVVNECILEKDFVSNNTHFKSGLEVDSFNQISKILSDLVKRTPKNFKTLITDQVDKQFREASKDKVPRSFRISYDRKTNRVMENIEKKRIDSLFIHTGDMKFDYRISLSMEIISNENPERFENKTPEIERQKLRTSTIHDKSSTRFDLTKVKQVSKLSRGNAGKTEVENLEVELEIDMAKLLVAIDNLSTDSFTFEDMTETLLDNARILNRTLNKQTA